MPTKQLKDGTAYEKATHHTEAVLKGSWVVTRKIDGVRAMRNADGAVVSRNGKPLHNLDSLDFNDAEIFRDDWSTSVSLVRSETYKEIKQSDVYELVSGSYDSRLETDDVLIDSTYEQRMSMMQRYVDMGYEGIVLRKVDSTKWVKVVPVLNADVRITGYTMGNGKNTGFIGSWETNHGNVGSGFTDAERIDWTAEGLTSFIGSIIEVQYRETTAAGKLRFPAFVRFRFDKDEESLT